MVTRRGGRQKSKRNQFNNRNDAKIFSECTKRLINMQKHKTYPEIYEVLQIIGKSIKLIKNQIN